MPTRQDFRAYHASIAAELQISKDRMRNLIGGRHWQSDGEHKEAILRKILRNHVAQIFHIGRGFVCTERDTSRQIDILIVQKEKPTLFCDGEMLVVTPDAVSAILEVKTKIGKDLQAVAERLADNAEAIRAAGNPMCVVGLFAYEATKRRNTGTSILRAVQRASRGQWSRTVNWVALGPDVFVRYWREGSAVHSPIPGGVWHSYSIPQLAHAYFVSNVVWDTLPIQDSSMQYAWFPIEGSKERYRQEYIAIDGDEPRSFHQ